MSPLFTSPPPLNALPLPPSPSPSRTQAVIGVAWMHRAGRSHDNICSKNLFFSDKTPRALLKLGGYVVLPVESRAPKRLLKVTSALGAFLGSGPTPAFGRTKAGLVSVAVARSPGQVLDQRAAEEERAAAGATSAGGAVGEAEAGAGGAGASVGGELGSPDKGGAGGGKRKAVSFSPQRQGEVKEGEAPKTPVVGSPAPAVGGGAAAVRALSTPLSAGSGRSHGDAGSGAFPLFCLSYG
jgi:hypothetical protein